MAGREALTPKGDSEYRVSAEQLIYSDHSLSASEIARSLGIHKLTVYRAAKAGRLIGFYAGASLRFEPKAVAAWLNTRGGQ
jgi:excisionase family DNA binding protein